MTIRRKIMPSIRLVIGGHAGHGKDEVCEIISQITGWKFDSSSKIAADVGIFDEIIKDEPLYDVYGLPCLEEGRTNLLTNKNHFRAEMFRLIQEYNTPDKTRLMKTVFERSSMYCGIRCREEFLSAKADGIVDFSIWVDSTDRVPPEPASSISVLKSDFDVILDNNGNLHELYYKLSRLVSMLQYAELARSSLVAYSGQKH